MSKLDTKFADMPEGERKCWLAWANSHDWGGGHAAHFAEDTGNLIAYGQMHHPETGWISETTYHETPRDLRNWAGY